MNELKKAIRGRRHLVFLDLEGTQFSHEMIAIGAVHVVLSKEGTIRKTYPGFKRLVLAKNNVGKVVVQLTGITNEMMKKEGVSYRKAMDDFKKYVGRSYSKSLFITFGNHDLRIISQTVSHNLDANKTDAKFIKENYLDLAAFISRYIKDEKGNSLSLDNSLKIFSIEFDGIKHDPLDDARNLALLYDAMHKNPDLLAQEYKKVLAKNRSLPSPLPKLINKLTKGEPVTPEDYEEMIREYVS
ncbi:MAG: 3'-5' exonuclease [Bacilli bacterium]|jgi:inhibitor of KinA sporulation pathway (predicted exonuclease)|nr:3'-5' exonuclease [Bacilli bacterium]